MRLEGQTMATINHHSARRCLVKPTRWVGLTQFISPLCVTSPCRHGNRGGSRTKTGVFHQDLHVRITQRVCVCVHVCSLFIIQQHVWSECFYTEIEPLGVSSPSSCLLGLHMLWWATVQTVTCSLHATGLKPSLDVCRLLSVQFISMIVHQ